MTKAKFTASLNRQLPQPTWRRLTFTALTLAGLFLTTAGCDVFMQKPHCPELDSCGGSLPVGDWVLRPGHPSCSEDLYIPAIDTRLFQGNLPAARTPFPEPALFDWCVLLVATGGTEIQARPPRFYYESGPIGIAAVSYKMTDMGNEFSAGITRTGTYTLDFPGFCMKAFGAKEKPVDPAQPNGEKIDVCKQLEGPLRESGIGEGSYPNTTCVVNPADRLGGCLCTFDVSETGGPAGSFVQQTADTLVHYSNTNFPQSVKYCNKGDTLELTGANGQYLFDQAGLRTMSLIKAPPPMP